MKHVLSQLLFSLLKLLLYTLILLNNFLAKYGWSYQILVEIRILKISESLSSFYVLILTKIVILLQKDSIVF